MRLPSFIRLALLTAILLGAAPASASVLIVIDKAAQRMSVAVNGVPLYNWAVSSGRKGYETPSGSFKPFRMEADHYSDEWDSAPMPHSIFFTTEGHAIHGSYETKRLGSPVSHGCVRLAPANAQILFALVKAEGLGNAKVVISGGEPLVIAKRAPQRQPVQIDQNSVYGASARDPYRETYGVPTIAAPAYPQQRLPYRGGLDWY